LNEGIVAEKRLSQIISGMTHGVVNLSTGTIDRFQKDFANRLTVTGELEGIKQDLLNGDVMHTDDTPLRTLERVVYSEESETGAANPNCEHAEKTSFRATVRTHSNERSTLYTVNPKKDIKGIERDGILPAYKGTLCQDDESKFYNYGSNNGTCGAHLSRELKGLCDLHNCPWAEEMLVFVTGMNKYKNNDLAAGVLSCDPQKLSFFESEYDHIIENGRTMLGQMKGDEWGYAKFRAMLNRLTKRKDNYMLFMRDYKVPFTNNLAERDLRAEKTKEKVSGLFRSWDGIVDHAKIRSFLSTAKKRGIDLCFAIREVIGGRPVLSQ